MEISIAGAAAWWILNLIEGLQEEHSISHEDLPDGSNYEKELKNIIFKL